MNAIEYSEITEPQQRSSVCDGILRALPEWFGREQAIVGYVDEVKDEYTLAALENGTAVGFVSLRRHNDFTDEVHVMGVRKEYHRRGIGRKLIELVCRKSKGDGKIFLSVKTLSDSDPYPFYALTRKFYRSQGFYPLEEITEIWGEDNPCLIMVKVL